MILHLEPKIPFEQTISKVIGAYVRDVDFQSVTNKAYSNILKIQLDSDLSPGVMKALSELVIMRKLRAYEFVGIEAKVIKNNDMPLVKLPDQIIIEALFINRR